MSRAVQRVVDSAKYDLLKISTYILPVTFTQLLRPIISSQRQSITPCTEGILTSWTLTNWYGAVSSI